MSGVIDPESMSQKDWYRWFTTAPTQHDIDAWTKPAPVDLLPKWRERNPTATCSDTAARALAAIEACLGRL